MLIWNATNIDHEAFFFVVPACTNNARYLFNNSIGHSIVESNEGLRFISMVGIFGQSTSVDDSDCSVCLLSRKNRCFFNARMHSYLNLHLFLLLLVYDIDF